MAEKISKETRLADLLARKPGLEDFLVQYHPAFKGLKSSFLRKTVGKVATIANAAGIAGVDADELVAAILKQVSQSDPAPDSGPQPDAAGARREALKGILRDLHAGAPRGEIQKRFDAFAVGMEASDVAAVEQELVAEGIPESEIKGLCDFHARLMGGAVPEATQEMPPGHPVHTLIAENAALEAQAKRLEGLIQRIGHGRGQTELSSVRAALAGILDDFGTLERHYQRKENQFFPFLEKHDITAPPQVMWAVHDDIRAMLKRTREALSAEDAAALQANSSELLHNFREMVFKEEKILIPLCLETFSQQEWGEIRKGESDIGYALVEPGRDWQAAEHPAASKSNPGPPDALRRLALDTGMLSLPQVNLLLKHLPVDITFVDEHDEVLYFSDTPERIFPRSPGIIGRKVHLCHPPKSVHVVEEILESFRRGKNDSAEFWFQMGQRFLHIRYFAMRDPLGKYRGCLEVSQDVTGIRALEGERRLLQWESLEPKEG